MCYTAGWAHYRPDPVQFHPEDVDTSLCTHLLFAFALLDPTGLTVVPDDPAHDTQMYVRLTNLKREMPHLKVMLSIGGWTMGSEEFTQTVSSQAHMHAAASSIIEYLHRYNFDGVDIDWEYPAARGSPPADKQRFTQFLKLLHDEFARDYHSTNRTHLLLSAAIAPSPARVQESYEIIEISHYLDFINLMTYDMHGPWDTTVGHHSSLYSPSGDPTDSVDYVINWIVNTTVDRRKLNLGLAFYGVSFNLTDTQRTSVGSPIQGAGKGGEILGEAGSLAYYEVCKLLTEHRSTITESGRLPGTQSPYVVDGIRWTGYDDVRSIQEKVAYTMQMGLGGVFIWTIDMDDFHGICGGGHYPLMTAIQQQFRHPLVGR